MGMYVIPCPVCGTHHYWFSGNLDQRCRNCSQSNMVRRQTGLCLQHGAYYEVDVCPQCETTEGQVKT